MASRADLARRPSPLVRSGGLLRAFASGLTLLSFGAMTYFAAGNLYESKAPLQPSAPVAVAATPAPTVAPATRPGRTSISPAIPTTTRAPLTRTRQSGR